MSDELIDIYNEENKPLFGVQKMKSEAHRKGLWHRASHVWIYNSKGEILLQLRAKNKEFWPNMWDISVAGHIGSGEDQLSATVRETEEEVGLRIMPDDLDYYYAFYLKDGYRVLFEFEDNNNLLLVNIGSRNDYAKWERI